MLSRAFLMLTTCIWLLASWCNLIYLCFFPHSASYSHLRWWVVLSITWAHGLTTASLSFSLLSTIPGCSVRVSTNSFLLIFPYPSFQCPSPSRGLSTCQHNLQKCFCESLLLFPSVLPIQPHFEASRDILLAFDYFMVIRHLSQTLSCLQICFHSLSSFGLPAVFSTLLLFSPHSCSTDLCSCFQLCAGSDHPSLSLLVL